jgi:hypothetical protein
MAVVTDKQLAAIEAEKARLATDLAGGPLARVAALMGKPSKAELTFDDPLFREGRAVVTVFQANGAGESLPIGYIEATDTDAKFHKTAVSDIPEFLLLAGVFILPILLLVFIVRGIIVLSSRDRA